MISPPGGCDGGGASDGTGAVRVAVGPHAARKRVNPPIARRGQSICLFTVVPSSEVLALLQSPTNDPAGPVGPGGNGAIVTGTVCQEKKGPPHLRVGGLRNAAVCTAGETYPSGHYVAAKRGYEDLTTCRCKRSYHKFAKMSIPHYLFCFEFQ